jgi:hypothetical protein
MITCHLQLTSASTKPADIPSAAAAVCCCCCLLLLLLLLLLRVFAGTSSGWLRAAPSLTRMQDHPSCPRNADPF